MNNFLCSQKNQSLWTLLKQDFKTLFSPDVFQNWFEPLECSSETDDTIVLRTSNDFAAIWLEENYLNLINQRLQLLTGRTIKASIEVEKELSIAKENNRETDDKIESSGQTNLQIHSKETLNSHNLVNLNSKNSSDRPFYNKKGIISENIDHEHSYAINSKSTFDNFVIGSGNQLAYAASLAIANNPPGRAYNPLFLYGATGLGKTHLMQSVAQRVMQTQPKLKVVYISTEKFTNEFIYAIQENLVSNFRKKYRTVDVLLIDDIHFLSGKERIQEEFFHTFNELFEAQKQIFLSSDRPASEIAKLEARLVSRFQWGLVCDIQPPDLETRVAIINKKANEMELNLPSEIVNFLAKKVTQNIRRIEGALLRIASQKNLLKDALSVESISKFLKDIIDEERKILVSTEVIQQKVCSFYNISLADLVGKKRPANIAFPRQVAMYLCRLLTTQSLQTIGTSFGGRDHGTVIHACKAVENIISQDDIAKRNLEFLQKQLTN